MRKVLITLSVVVMISMVFGVAHAETYDINITQDGFALSHFEIVSGDTVRFINADMRDYGSVQELEPHCVSDPFAQPYTEESCWIVDGSTPSISYTLASSQVFYDRFFDVAPITISIEDSQTTTSDSDIDSAPTYTGTVDELTLQSNLADITAQLTDSLSTIGTLQSQLETKNLEIQTLQNQVVDVSPYETQISSLTAERDQWKQTAENWYAVAMEQVQVMINVLGL